MSGVNKGNVEFLKELLRNIQIKQNEYGEHDDIGWTYFEGYKDGLKLAIYYLEDNDDY